MGRVTIVAVCSLLYLAPCRASMDDAAALVQMTPERHGVEDAGDVVGDVKGRGKKDAQTMKVSSAVRDDKGPLVYTRSGPIRGVYQDESYIFKGIPYAEVPERFAVSKIKAPWTKTLQANEWGASCVGARNSRPQAGESEDCLKLTIWAPPTGQKDLPVVVYFHGGQNQRGSAQESTRQGDVITRDRANPIIYVNFDYRLGIFGWVQGYNLTANLGFRDQQLALHWIREHISAFGGNPKKVTLQGHSEGAHNIVAHMTSPQSRGLFARAILHSPPANIWSRKTNVVRTNFIIERSGCAGLRGDTDDMLKCLREVPLKRLLGNDWSGAALVRNVGERKWSREIRKLQKFERALKLPEETPSFLGWHPVVDGHIIPHEPRMMIRKGDWNKVPVLITMSRNETMGLIPITNASKMEEVMMPLFASGEYPQVKRKYMLRLATSGILVKDELSLVHQIVTDKMWTCDIRSMANDMVNTGGEVYVEMFAHKPKYDPEGAKINDKCISGATCHSAEMLYALPQGRGKGIPSQPTFIKELDFARTYAKGMLSFAYAKPTEWWARWNTDNHPMTFVTIKGATVVEDYKEDLCRILDSSMGEALPAFYKQ